jgi:osmoprotectant transport system substrate-binding protein
MVRLRKPLWRVLALLLAMVMVAAACGDDDDATEDDAATDDTAEDEAAAEAPLEGVSLTVGSKEFDEQLILGHMTRLVLEDAGADVDDEIGLIGSDVVREAFENGDIDIYWEYLGTAWVTYLGNEEAVSADPQEQVEALREEDEGFVWLEPTGFNNTYGVAMTAEQAEEFGATAVSDIPDIIAENPDATLCGGTEFTTREDGMLGLQDAYGFEFPNVNEIDDALVYDQLADGSCPFGSIFATDGRIEALDLVMLEDDMGFFPPFQAAVTVREDAYDPAMDDLFNPIAEALDEPTMIELNRRVSVDEEDPEAVAQDWLQENGFIS